METNLEGTELLQDIEKLLKEELKYKTFNFFRESGWRKKLKLWRHNSGRQKYINSPLENHIKSVAWSLTNLGDCVRGFYDFSNERKVPEEIPSEKAGLFYEVYKSGLQKFLDGFKYGITDDMQINKEIFNVMKKHYENFSQPKVISIR